MNRLPNVINLTNDDEFRRNLEQLELGQIGNYRSAFNEAKRNGQNAYRYRDEYYDNARFVVYADPGNAGRFCRCGISQSTCGLRRYCTRCAYLDFLTTFKPFEHSFHKGTFYSVTLSYSDGLAFGDKFQSEEYWKATRVAIERLVKGGEIDGAVVVGEMAVTRLTTVTLNPHSHAIVHADHWTPDLERELEIEMELYLRETLDEPRRRPDVRSYAIDEVESFEGAFRYMFKPMDFVTPYLSVVNEYGATPEVLAILNANVKELIRSLTEVMKNGETGKSQRLLRYYGTMQPQSKGYIGEKKQKRRVKKVRPSRPSDRIAVPAPRPDRHMIINPL